MSRVLKVLCAVALGVALTAPTAAPSAAQSTVRVAMGTDTQSLTLPRGRSAAVELPVDARDVIVSNPAVAEAMLHSPRRITVIGIAPGETDAVFLDASGRAILSLSIRVDAGTAALQDTISRLMPDSDVRVEAVNESLILTGTVSNPAAASRAQQIAAQFVSSPERVLNMLSVTGSDQVTLRVRVVEVQRNTVKQLGIDMEAVLDSANDAFTISRGNSFGVSGGLLGGGGVEYESDDFDATLRAFERVGLVRTLAEPNLTSVNGESASFLAGGEFPVPVGRDNQGNILIEFKPFGVSLAFRPIVLSGGRISLQLTTEVSELTNQGAFTIGGEQQNALVIPALNVRRTSTTVEMPSGGSLMIAGLLKEETRQTIDSLPGATNLPVLGALFRSRDYLQGETELVFIVEPYIVTPTSPDRMQTPADGLQIASDAQTLLFGRLNQAYGPADPAAAAPASQWQGPVGYVIE